LLTAWTTVADAGGGIQLLAGNADMGRYC